MWMERTLAAQTFIQMSDPQFGMYTNNANFEHETVNFEFAIASANRLKPAFVVITGDLINDAKSAAQAAEYKRIPAKLDRTRPEATSRKPPLRPLVEKTTRAGQ
jgi:hypothetical protein